MIKFLATDLKDNKDKNNNDELESVHYSCFKSLFEEFNNGDKDCKKIRIQKIDFLKTVFLKI